MQVDFNTSEMTFPQALFFAETTGCSIVPCRYSTEAKNRVQFFFKKANNGCTYLYSQDGDKAPKILENYKSYFGDTWEKYKGSYLVYNLENEVQEDSKKTYKQLLGELEKILQTLHNFET